MSSFKEEDHQHLQRSEERTHSNAESAHSSNGRKERKAAKKRKREEDSSTVQFGMGSTLSVLRPPELPGFNLTSTRPTSQEENSAGDEEQEWTTVENGRPSKKAKKIPKPESLNYPAITFSPDSRFNSSIKIADLQGLVLYLLADGPAPQWVSVKHRPQFRKVVVLMIPGLEKDMFIRKQKEKDASQEDSRRNSFYSPDEYYPVRLSSQDLPKELEYFLEMFEHAWPVKTPGDDKFNRMHSPLHAMLTAPAPREKEEKKQNKRSGPKAVKPESFAGERTRITEFLCSVTNLEENEYVLHPAMYDDKDERAIQLERRKTAGNSQADGWVDSSVDKYEDGSIPERDIEQGSLTAGRTVLAMDCEMCMTDANEFSLTRISIVAWDGSVVMDELVKPAKPITDYLTMYSGITEAMLKNVETTLQDIQQKLLTLLTPQTILIGHSLDSDLKALKFTHPYIIDTALIYPHPRGPPLKQGLKYLAQKFLNKTIQAGHGTTGPGAGHDSIEDARTCLDLVKQKCEKGKAWGINETGENLFRRLARAGARYKNQEGRAIVSEEIGGKSSAAVDWGDPKKGAGAAATVVIRCQSDEDVVAGVRRAVLGDPDGKEVPGGGVDFVWARMRELESLKGWWNENKGRQDGLGKSIDTVNTAGTAPVEGTSTSTSPLTLQPEDQPQAQLSEQPSPSTQMLTATENLTRRLQTIYDFLPPCTAFIIYSGSGDPREMSKLQQMQTTFKREYRSKKWDELSVRWTDVEEQALKKAAKRAREGVGFVGVK